MSRWVKKVIGKLIGDVQNAFVEGFYIVDGVLIANETMDFLKRTKMLSLIFKVDFEKFYDSLEWDFLLQIMRCMGFRSKWCKWVEAC